MVENSIALGWESERSCRSWAVRCEPPDSLDDPLAYVTPGLDALFAFADGLLKPLRLRTEIGLLEVEHGLRAGYPRHMEWELAVPRVRNASWPVPETRHEVDAIDRANAEQFVGRAISQEAPPSQIACPMSISLTYNRVRFLDAPAEATTLRLGPGLDVPIERDAAGAWVMGYYGPLVTSPVELLLSVDAYELQLWVRAHWSPWADEGRAGTRAIEERVARLCAAGWEPVTD